VEIIGHRGASFDAPENTLASVRLAFEQGADAAEIDIRLTGDGKIVAMHDATTKRTTGVNLSIAQTPLEELRGLNAGCDEKIPELREVLAIVPDKKKLVIEIKSGEEILPALAADLARAKPEQIVLIAFDEKLLRAAKERMLDFSALWIVDYKRSASLPSLIAQCAGAGFDGLDLSQRWTITREDIAGMTAMGLRTCYVWTVDKPSRAQQLMRAGIDGLTTNRPGWMREQLTSRAAAGSHPAL